MATDVNAKIDNKHMPKTAREQIFYMYGNIMGREADEVGNIMINVDWIVHNFEKALELAHNESLPKITYRDVELPKGTFVTSTSYPAKREGVPTSVTEL